MRKRIISIILMTALFVTLFSFMDLGTQQASAEQTFQKVPYISGIVTAVELNVRKGPSTDHDIVSVLKNGTWVNILAKIGNWYAIYYPDTGIVGCVHGDYLKTPDESDSNQAGSSMKANNMAPAASTPAPQEQAKADLSTDEQKLLDLINKERASAGLKALQADPELMNVARTKAKDMVDNNYFSHQSPTYGSPFDMMRQFGISFKAAGENIAGNQSVEGAVQDWMNSEGHRKNILNGNFNYTGIGIYADTRYGKVLVQQFIGR